MTRFRSRLLFALITLISLVFIGLGLLLGHLFENYYLKTIQTEMNKEAKLVSLTIQNQQIAKGNGLENILNTIGESLEIRITILKKDGTFLFDSFENNISDEIDTIIQKQLPLTKEFHIMSEKDNTFYYGLPLENENERFVIISSPITSLLNVSHKVWILLIVSLGLALLVILIIGVKITSQYTKPIEAATKVAIELAKGNYKARTYETHLDETGVLNQSLNKLARNIENVTTAHEIQQDRLRTIIENMGSGLLLIDRRGYIKLVNRTYRDIFHVKSSEYLSQLYYEVILYDEVISIVEEVFMTEEIVRRQLVIPLKIERKHFEVYCAPIISTKDKWNGVIVVFHDITELKKLEQTRKDFVANVSHELRTPVTSIKGFTETLLDGAMNDTQSLEYFLSIILKESDRLQNLIQELLELSRIEQQGFALSVQEVDIKEILLDVVMMVKGSAEKKQLALELEYEEGNAYVAGDYNRLKQIFINLLNNAINYTQQGGSVKVIILGNKENIEIQISDTGIGISDEEIPRIFERFYRVDKARSRNSGGTGLGLAIVKHLVEAHGGLLTVTSKLGEGTTFSVILNRK